MDADEFDVVQRFFASQYLDNPILHHKRDKLLFEWVRLASLDTKQDQESLLFALSRKENDLFRKIGEHQETGRALAGLDPSDYAQWFQNMPLVEDESASLALSSTCSRMAHIFTAFQNHTGPLSSVPKRFERPLPAAGALWRDKWNGVDALVSGITAAVANETVSVVVLKYGHGTAIATTDFVCLMHCCGTEAPADPDLLLTWDQLLMVKDMCYSRFQVHIAALWHYDDPHSLLALIEDQWSWQMECLTRYGNKGYEIAKCTEELSKAYLTHVSDDLFGEDGPFLRFVDKVRTKEAKLGAVGDFMADRYATILKRTRSVTDIVELFGLQKVCGHPLIDPVAGGLSAAEEARADDKTTFTDARRIKNNFCRIYLQAYVAKHGKWPPLVFDKNEEGPVVKKTKKRRHVPTALERLHNIQYRHLTLSSYPLDDWNTCRFKKHQEFNYHDNFLDLMDDKSISYYRSQKHATWDKGVSLTSNKRLLLEMISRRSISPREIVDRVMRRDIPLDWFIVSLYPKEREFKIAARMFSMLVFEIRLYFALTEANLADGIFPYLPQQTMTKDKISVLRTFGDITKPMADANRVRFFLEADLSRWNLRWRALTVHMIGDVIDDIFGLRGVFTFVHEFFAACVIIVRTPDTRPPDVEKMTPPESPTLWYDHVGGFEGITQKLWSACTYSMVDLALHPFPVSYILIGQGDNQVLSITAEVHHRETAKEVARRYCSLIMDRLDDECKRTNQNLKPEECLESGTVLTYSKDVYVKGVDYHTTLKAHSRLFPHSSSDFPSVATNIGAIFSSAMAGAERSRFPFASYALAHYHSYSYLYHVFSGRGMYGKDLRAFRKRINLPRQQDFFDFLLWLPSEMGGLAIQGPANFLYKGGSDPLSRALSSVVLLGRTYPSHPVYGTILRDAQEGKFLNHTPRLAALVQDPYGLPIHKPATPADRVASATLAELRPSVINRDLQEVMSTNCQDFGDALIDHLVKMEPFNPLVAHDIYDCSVAGIVDTLSRMLTATRTIQTFVRAGGSTIVETLMSQERSTWLYLLRRAAETPQALPVLSLTIFDTVSRLRSSWKRNEGTEPVGVTTYHPLDFPVVWGPSALSQTGISILLPATSDPLFSRGHHDPYLGSMTREKRSEHGYRIVGADTASAGFRKLQLIASQVKGDANVTQLIDIVGLTRSNTLLSPISGMLTTVVGGTVGHRYASRLGHLGAYLLGSFALASNVVISSDNAGCISGGLVDYPVMVQEYFLTLLGFLHIQLADSPTSRVRIGTICIGETPLVPADTRPVAMNSPVTLKPFSLPLNALAFKSDMELHHNRSLFASSAFAGSVFRGSLKRTPAAAREVLVAWVRSIFREKNRARAIADSTASHAGRLFASLDLAETAAVGYTRLINAMGVAVAEEGIYNLWRSAHHRSVRWKLVPFMWKLSEALALVAAEHLGHPMVSSDGLCKKHGLYAGPVYAGGTVRIHLKLAGLICEAAQSQIRQRTSYLYAQRMAVFASDPELGASEVTYKALCLVLHKAWLNGSLTKEDVTWLMTRYIMPLGSSKETEEARMTEARALAYGLVAWARTQNREDLAHDLERLAEGHRLVLYPIAISEALRDMRKGHEWGLVVESYRELRSRPAVSNAVPCKMSWSRSPVLATPAWRTLPFIKPDRTSIMQGQLLTSHGRIHGTHSSAHYSFDSLWNVVRHRDVLIIGTGHGAVARLCLELGARAVFGLDLASTLPLEGHNFRWYIPPMVRESEDVPKYLQLPQSFTTSGNWNDPDVASEVLESMVKSTVVIVDIQAGAGTPSLSVLDPLIAASWPGLVIVRLYVTKDIMELLLSDVSAAGANVTVHLGAPERPSSEPQMFILTFRSLPSHPSSSDSACVSLHLQYGGISPMPFMGGGREYLLGASVHYIVPVESTSSVLDLRTRLAEVVSVSHGEYLSRPSYRQWTLMLHALVACDFLITSDAGRSRLLARLAEGSSLSVRSGSLRLSVGSSFSLIRHLCKIVARCL
jgi:hypothetical protein